MAKKSAYSVRIKNSNDYVFWMIEHGSTQPRDEFVYNAEMGTTRDNPRTEEELEFREQLFLLYDYQSKGYPSGWVETLTYYRFLILYFIFLVFIYSVNIPIIPKVIYKVIYLATLLGRIYWLIKIFNNLFYQLSAEVDGE